MAETPATALVERLIRAVADDATACEDGGFGDYTDERDALLAYIADLESRAAKSDAATASASLPPEP